MRKTIQAAIIGGSIALTTTAAMAYDATAIVKSEAVRQGVPVDFALKVAKLESGVQCNNHNRRSTASGPLQILASTARSFGYSGNIRKASCYTQTRYGMMHLSMCYKGAHGNRALALKCHQRGISVLYGKKAMRKR